MASGFAAKRLFKPVAFAAAFTISGSTAFYISSRSRKEEPFQPLRPHHDRNGRIIPPKFPSIKSRIDQIADLKKSSTDDNTYDLLVIGGGATGTGIALDAVTRGLKVALVERDDFSSGTSSKSTKLVHGGVRYLEKAFWDLDYSQYELVKEALTERKNFLYTAPHLSNWLPIMLPLQKWWQAPYFWAGAKLYDFLAGSEGNPSSYFLSGAKALEAFPLLKKDSLVGALVYYDGQHNDSRMNTSLAMTASLYGATTVNHLEVTSLEKDANGQLCGAQVRDMISTRDGDKEGSEEFFIRAKGIINATGPFADAIQQMDEPKQRELVAPSLGTHVVLPGYLSPEKIGLLDPATSDGRVIFFLPWQGNIIVGTTDAPCAISKNPVPTEQDINWILNEVKGYLSPDVNIQRSDVLAAWAGIRPLVRDPNSKNTESLVRSHLVTVSKSGLLTCAGGKWTTYRQMAEDAVDKAIEVFDLHPRGIAAPIDISGLNKAHPDTSINLNGSCQTHRLRLLGAHGFSNTLYIDLIKHFNLDADIAQHLAENYGDRAWQVAAQAAESGDVNERISRIFPYTTAEVLHAVHNEYACTAVDVLSRRTRLSFLNAQAALEALPQVIDLMGEELRWSDKRRASEWNDTVQFLGSMGLTEDKMALTRQEVLAMKGKKATIQAAEPEQEQVVAEDREQTSKPVLISPPVRPGLSAGSGLPVTLGQGSMA